MQTTIIRPEFQQQIHTVLGLLDQIGPLIPVADRWNYTVKQLEKGMTIQLADTIYLVTSSPGRYAESGYHWLEYQLQALTGSHIGSIHYLEWEEDDEVEIVLSYQRLKLTDIKLDVEAATSARSIRYHGRNYRRDESYTVMYTRNEESAPEEAYMIEFEGRDGEYLTIEQWSTNDFEVWLSRDVDPRSFQVLALPKMEA